MFLLSSQRGEATKAKAIPNISLILNLSQFQINLYKGYEYFEALLESKFAVIPLSIRFSVISKGKISIYIPYIKILIHNTFT